MSFTTAHGLFKVVYLVHICQRWRRKGRGFTKLVRPEVLGAIRACKEAGYEPSSSSSRRLF